MKPKPVVKAEVTESVTIAKRISHKKSIEKRSMHHLLSMLSRMIMQIMVINLTHQLLSRKTLQREVIYL
jgi:hypothetical protein